MGYRLCLGHRVAAPTDMPTALSPRVAMQEGSFDTFLEQVCPS